MKRRLVCDYCLTVMALIGAVTVRERWFTFNPARPVAVPA
jgi:hypothetical protein